MREIPVYHLVIGKGGIRMKQLPADANGNIRIDRSTKAVLFPTTMSNLVTMAQGSADRLVIDSTGLTGMFERTLRFGLSAGGPTGASAQASPLSRFEDSTGLRLVPGKETVEVIVIDHADRPEAN
jgi:uncharacterized protein (TIGR03435 family)